MEYFLINDIWLSYEEADEEMFKRLSPEAGIPTSVNAIRGNELVAFPHRYHEFRKAMSRDDNVRSVASAKELIASRCIRFTASPFPFHRNSSSSLRMMFALNYFLINGVLLPNEEVDKELFKRLK
ncbi:MAG: hypothetical protein IJ599_01040 [Alphaproteobacteria bacterium]|nr:hypothetical protein [Alphaproteobacteria bacterium]